MHNTAPDVKLSESIVMNEIDSYLNEEDFKLKKKIFSLPKMEALVFSDPKLSAEYNKMMGDGKDDNTGTNRYGYHANETVQNILFNDYVLNSPKYLQKYKMAIPVKKERRDQSGINQLKQAGEEKMKKTDSTGTKLVEPKVKSEVDETSEPLTKVLFLVNEKDPKNPDLFAYFPEENYDNKGNLKVGYSHVGQHGGVDPRYAKESRLATPEEYQNLKTELESIGYNFDVLNSTNESTGAAGGSGAFAPALGYKKNTISEENEIDEPNEEDCFISSNGYKLSVSCGGKFIGEFVEDQDAFDAVKTWKDSNKWYPNTWFISDHGNYSLVDDNGNILNEMTGTGAAGGAGDTGSNVSGSGAYVGPSVWGSGDLMKVKGKSKVKTKPMFPGGTIIQENKNYLVDPSGFENFIKILNEEDLSYQTKLGQEYKQSHTGSNKGLGVSEIPQTSEREKSKKGIDDNTSLYIGQDVDKMRDDDVKILHNDMTQKHSYFPHPDNPNLPDDGISGINQQGKEISKPFGTNKEKEDNFIIDKTNAFTSDAVKHWNNKDTGIELNTIKTGDPDKPNLNTMEESKKIEEKAKSASQQRLFGMAHAVQKGELSPNKVSDKVNKIAKNVSKKDVEDFASTKHDKLPDKVDEDSTTMANASKMQPKEDSMSNKMDNTTMPVGMQQTSGGMNEDFKLLEELNNELNAYSIHHQKLIKMSEDRKPSALVLKDRVTGENPVNFKKDLQHSGTKEIIDVEKELQWKDQQTDVGKDPQKLGQDIEEKEIKTTDAKGDESLKNVGDSTNNKGDEIPKRNMTTEEQDEVNLYRNGQHSLVYDNEPGKRFEDRMKKDMGDKVYNIRQKQLKFKGKAPMYNKDPQPIEKGIDKTQFNKEKSGFNDGKGLNESMVTGRYIDALDKRRLIDFKLNEVKNLITPSGTARQTGLFELDFTGLGNTYNSKTIDNKVIVNEAVVKAMSEHKFYTDGKIVFAIKNPVQKLNENEQKVEKPVINEQMDKMKHLLGYNPETFTNTNNVKKNRGF
jgi:hypothetical protein